MNTHQILIASYPPDYPWLYHCLRSLEKFSEGFLPPVVSVAPADVETCQEVVARAKSSATVKPWAGVGFARAQESMLSADLLCESDYYWLLGSDCVAVAPFKVSDYCNPGGKPYLLFHSWRHMEKHSPETLFWRAGVEEALGWASTGEFMRRLPLGYRCDHLPAFRDHIAAQHGCRFTPFITDRVNRVRNFSESNVLGEWLWTRHRADYHWVNLDEGSPSGHGFESWPTSPITQCWSWGGFDRPHDSLKITPREIITKALGTF